MLLADISPVPNSESGAINPWLIAESTLSLPSVAQSTPPIGTSNERIRAHKEQSGLKSFRCSVTARPKSPAILGGVAKIFCSRSFHSEGRAGSVLRLAGNALLGLSNGSS